MISLIRSSTTIYDNYGIITIRLVDPLSLIITKLLGLRDEAPNAVGFYYKSSSKISTSPVVTLFNVYNTNRILYFSNRCTIEILSNSHIVSKIWCYPLVTELSSTSRILLQNSTANLDKNIEKLFNNAVLEGIRNNNRLDNNSTYRDLLLNLLNHKNLIDFTTGYNIVNKVLLTLMSITVPDSCLGLISCPLLKKQVLLISSQKQKYSSDEIRLNLTKFTSTIIDLIVTSDKFRTHILESLVDKNSPHNIVTDNIQKPYDQEELTSLIVNNINNGTINIDTLTNVIKNHQELPSITRTPVDNIQHPSYDHSSLIDDINNLGTLLYQYTQSFNQEPVLVINIDDLISRYNAVVSTINLIHKPTTSLSSIKTDADINTDTKSRQGIIVLTAEDDKNVPITIFRDIGISMYDNKLETLTTDHLLTLLIYIESLRNSDGNGSTRFITLQNNITSELASRNKNNQ